MNQRSIIRRLLLPLAFACVPVLACAQAFTDYAENKVGDHLLRSTAFTAPSTYYVALFLNSSNCTDAGGGTEVSGGSYARVSISKADASWKGTHGSATGASSGTGGAFTNAAAITFATATADWGTIGSWALMDASSGGNSVFCATLTATRNITTGATPSFAVDALSITFQ